MVLFHWKIADRLPFSMKTEEIQAARMTLWTISKFSSWTTAKSHELTENVSCVDSDRKEGSEPQDYPCFLTNRRGRIELVDDLVLKG